MYILTTTLRHAAKSYYFDSEFFFIRIKIYIIAYDVCLRSCINSFFYVMCIIHEIPLDILTIVSINDSNHSSNDSVFEF